MNAEPPPRTFNDRPRLWIEVIMATLAMISLWLALEPSHPHYDQISWSIWGIFVVEYGARLVAAPRRWRFVRSNLFDLLAIFPADAMRAFRMIRLLRVLQFLRGMSVLRRVRIHLSGILRTNGLAYGLLVVAIVVLSSGLLIVKLEPNITNVGDGIWWSIATTTGYGDLAPRTTEGRVLAAALMILGIGLIAMLTGGIATYFIGGHGPHNPRVRHVQKQLDEWDRMSKEERLTLAGVLRSMAEGEGPEKS